MTLIRSWSLLGCWIVVSTTACSSEPAGRNGRGNAGGTASTATGGAGGSAAAGGTTAAGGTSAGGSAAGGSASGGSASGGTAAGGSAAGGSAGTASGGTSGAGGSTSTGGTAGNGGTTSTCTPGTGTTVENGVVTDNATCLMWEETPGFIMGGNWEPSRDYCENLALGGFDDWRMPTVEELNSTPVRFSDKLMTSPRYVPTGGDLGNFHYCGVTHYDPDYGVRGCGWFGPGNTDGTLCVRGTAAAALSPPGGCTCQTGADGYEPHAE